MIYWSMIDKMVAPMRHGVAIERHAEAGSLGYRDHIAGLAERTVLDDIADLPGRHAAPFAIGKVLRIGDKAARLRDWLIEETHRDLDAASD